MATAMMPIGPAPVMSTSSPTMSKESAACVALPKGSKIAAISEGIASRDVPRVGRRQRQVLGEAAVAVHADADRVRAQVAPPGPAAAADAAHDVAFARDPLADREAAHAVADLHDAPDELVAE